MRRANWTIHYHMAIFALLRWMSKPPVPTAPAFAKSAWLASIRTVALKHGRALSTH